MSETAMAKIAAPFFIGDWLSLNWVIERRRERDDLGRWAEVVIGMWERTNDPAVADHQAEVRAALERIGPDTPEGVIRFILKRPPYEDPSIITFTLVALAEPVRVGVKRHEKLGPGRWALRGRGQRHEVHAELTGAEPSDAALRQLFREIDVENGEKKEGALKQIGDFFSFWSFGGRA